MDENILEDLMRDMGEIEWDSEPEDGEICDSEKENVLHCPVQECKNKTFKKTFTSCHWLEVFMPCHAVKLQDCNASQRVFRRLSDAKRHSLKFHEKEMGSKLVVRDNKFFVDPQGVQMPTCNLVKQMPGRSVGQLMTNSIPILDRTRPLSMGSSPPKPANNNPITDRKRLLSMGLSSPKPAKTVCIVPISCNFQTATSQIARVPGAHRVGWDLQQQKGSEVSSSSSTCTTVIQSSCNPLPTS